MAGVGRKTIINHVQAHRGFDDDFEWFGGTVNTSFLVASACGDDCFDTQLGTVGGVQFGVAMQEAESVETPGSNGFENDNSEFGFNNTPINNPKYCNITALGANAQRGNPRYDQPARHPQPSRQRDDDRQLDHQGFPAGGLPAPRSGDGGARVHEPGGAQHDCADRSDHQQPLQQQRHWWDGRRERRCWDVRAADPARARRPSISLSSRRRTRSTPTTPASGRSAADRFRVPASFLRVDRSRRRILRADCTLINSSFVAAHYIGAFAARRCDWTSPWTSYS